MIKIGIVGMGIRGNMFSQFIKQNPYAELVAFSEPNKEKRETAAKKWGVTNYATYENMFQEVSLDAAIITTPDFLHREPVMMALEKNLHVLVEKPFSQILHEAEEMYEFSNKVGTKCLVAFENRWNPVILQAKKQIEEGQIGRVLTVNGLQSNTVFVPLKLIPWASQTTCGWFLLSHLLDMSFYLTGKNAVSVFAHGTKNYLKTLGVDTYDYIHTIVKYEDGTDGIFESVWCLPESFPHIYDVKCSLFGEKGYLNLDFGRQMIDLASKSFQYLDALFVETNDKLIGFPGLMLDDFVDSIRLDKPTGASFEDGLRNTRLLCALHHSLETGKEELV